MGLFKKNRKNGGLIDVIRCDEPSYLIWKWHPSGVAAGDNQRENSVRWGSSLRVKDGEVAVFVYKQKDGTVQDFIVGPFDENLKTKNLPVLTSLYGLMYEGETPFQAEVYFINLSKIIQIKFAIPFFDIYDPRYPDFGVPVAVRGTIGFKVDNYQEFIKIHRLISFSLSDFEHQIKDSIINHTKNAVANIPTEANIPVIQIERKTVEISNIVHSFVKEKFLNTFGVKIVEFDISAAEIDKSSDGYRQLMSITKDITAATIQAQTAANLENYAETLKIQREEGQYALHKQTQTANIGAYQIEKQSEVGIAGAEALGQMGANNAGNVNINSGDGFNMAAIMTQMAIGGAIGQNLAGSMNNMMSGINSAPSSPPPIPTVQYYIAIDGNPSGPHNIQSLRQMIDEGTLSKKTLVWKNGMDNWVKAESTEEIAALFPSIPAIPTE